VLIVGHMHPQQQRQLEILTASFLLAGLLLRPART
jgi:hypothetical protein